MRGTAYGLESVINCHVAVDDSAAARVYGLTAVARGASRAAVTRASPRSRRFFAGSALVVTALA